jgi:hypothetical protein
MLPLLSKWKDKILFTARDRGHGATARSSIGIPSYPDSGRGGHSSPNGSAPSPSPLLPLRWCFLLTYGFCRDFLPSSSMVAVAASRLPSPNDGGSGGHPPPARIQIQIQFSWCLKGPVAGCRARL